MPKAIVPNTKSLAKVMIDYLKAPSSITDIYTKNLALLERIVRKKFFCMIIIYYY